MMQTKLYVFNKIFICFTYTIFLVSDFVVYKFVVTSLNIGKPMYINSHGLYNKKFCVTTAMQFFI